MSESFQLRFEPAIGPLTYGLMGTLMRAQREAGRGDQRKNTQKYPQSHPQYSRQAASREPCASEAWNLEYLESGISRIWNLALT